MFVQRLIGWLNHVTGLHDRPFVKVNGRLLPLPAAVLVGSYVVVVVVVAVVVVITAGSYVGRQHQQP